MPVADTLTGLRLGTIDAAEISFPLIDKAVGMNKYASHYYFSGWHQQMSLITFTVNQDVWDDLEEQERFAIHTSCAANVTYTMAEGEAKELEPLADLQAEGVTLHTWNNRMMSAFRVAWDEVVAEQSKEDTVFARAWKSLSDLRANFATWLMLRI